jgi:predicted GNAT family acetyltransferase
MEVRRHDSADDFRRVAVDIYRRDPVVSTIELMVLRGSLVDRNPGTFVTVLDQDAVVGAAFQTLRSPLLCSGLPAESVESVAAEIAGAHLQLNGVHGPTQIATSFAAAWSAATGAATTQTTQERLNKLGTLEPPTVDGEARLADSRDEGLVALWLNRFRTEALRIKVEPGAKRRRVRIAVEPPDEFMLWIVDGQPVSAGGLRAPTEGVSRIGPVYTPTEHRGKGYGSAVTAAVAARALESGADEVVLFTDLTNPALEAIYQRLGFQPVTEFVRFDFTVSK